MGISVPIREVEATQEFDVLSGDIRDTGFQFRLKDALNAGWKPAGAPLQDGGYFLLAVTRFVNKDGEPIPMRTGFGGMGGASYG